ncbi:MAG: hypothetical protein JXO72_16295 [Vicinamibacteria bacterium]|nr:hypothetical protein [Vicinamibacteria bacterium]
MSFNECTAAQNAFRDAALPIIAALCLTAIALSSLFVVLTLRRLNPTSIVGLLAVSAAKPFAQFPVWAAVWVFLHLGGIGLRYRFGSCHPISILADHSLIVIPTAMIASQFLVDLVINSRFYQKSGNAFFLSLHILSWLLVSPIVFILLSILEYLVRRPY